MPKTIADAAGGISDPKTLKKLTTHTKEDELKEPEASVRLLYTGPSGAIRIGKKRILSGDVVDLLSVDAASIRSRYSRLFSQVVPEDVVESSRGYPRIFRRKEN